MHAFVGSLRQVTVEVYTEETLIMSGIWYGITIASLHAGPVLTFIAACIFYTSQRSSIVEGLTPCPRQSYLR